MAIVPPKMLLKAWDPRGAGLVEGSGSMEMGMCWAAEELGTGWGTEAPRSER